MLPEKLAVLQPVKKFHAFYGTRSLTTVFTRARSIQYTPPSYISKLSLILTSYLNLGLPNGLFPSSFPTISVFLSIWRPQVADGGEGLQI